MTISNLKKKCNLVLVYVYRISNPIMNISNEFPNLNVQLDLFSKNIE